MLTVYRGSFFKHQIRLKKVLVVCGLAALSLDVWAADTVETWEAGAFDVDFYLGLEGVSAQKSAGSATSEIMLGYGISDRFSVYVGSSLAGQRPLSEMTGLFYLGVFGTPIDTNWMDLDLFLDFRIRGALFDELVVAPALELNLDLGSHWGLYLRSRCPLKVTPAPPVWGEDQDQLHLASTLGAYWTLAEGQQLLVEYGWQLHLISQPETPIYQSLGVALGYNFVVNGTLELVTQVTLTIPETGESMSLGFMTGFIASLPASRSL